MRLKTYTKEKLLSLSSSASGIMGFLGSYQVCHNICLGVIAVLAAMGIVLTGMPLLFLTKVAIPFWLAAVALLGISIFLYVKKHCINRNLLIFNTGLLIAAVPFPSLQKFALLFWIGGGLIMVISILFYLKQRRGERS